MAPRDVANLGTDAMQGRQTDVEDQAKLGLNKKSRLSEMKLTVKPFNSEFDSTNTLSPVKTTTNAIKKLLGAANPEKVTAIRYLMPNAEAMYGQEMRKLNRLEFDYQRMREQFYGAAEDSKNRVKVLPLYGRDGVDEKKVQSNAENL